jgi:hypothetical protein
MKLIELYNRINTILFEKSMKLLFHLVLAVS